MFNPLNELCCKCGIIVEKFEAQQLVLDNGEWRRMHQKCYDAEKSQQQRRSNEFQRSTEERITRSSKRSTGLWRCRVWWRQVFQGTSGGLRNRGTQGSLVVIF